MSWRIRGGRPLQGAIRLPGDKSITHRALILGALATGETRISGGGWGADCLSTVDCLRRLGCAVSGAGSGLAVVAGAAGRFNEGATLDCGNSGTTMRLLAGALAGCGVAARLDGDASLRQRPMARVAEPLRAMGAAIDLAAEDRPPLTLRGREAGAGHLRGVTWRTSVASAQVKSAILLAGLGADGPTAVSEPTASRDHTERMLATFGASVTRPAADTVIVQPAILRGQDVVVPRDFSAAAFWLGAALALPGSRLSISGVGVNPTRTGLLTALRLFGGDVALTRLAAPDAAEPMADLFVTGADGLIGAQIGGDIVPLLIDELPLLATLATVAKGETRITGAAELRVKECDRITAMTNGLRAFGADIDELPDGWLIRGVARLRPASVNGSGDHRVAMALAVAALLTDGISEVTDLDCAVVSDEWFIENLRSLGALI